MNGKRAKELRKLAAENTIGNEDIFYVGFLDRHVELQPGCTRHEEKTLKQKYKGSRKRGVNQT